LNKWTTEKGLPSTEVRFQGAGGHLKGTEEHATSPGQKRQLSGCQSLTGYSNKEIKPKERGENMQRGPNSRNTRKY
jgi:hypothetical protein